MQMGCLPFILAAVTAFICFSVDPQNTATNMIITLSVLTASGTIVYLRHRKRARQQNRQDIARQTYSRRTVERRGPSRETNSTSTRSRMKFSDITARTGLDLPGTDLTGLSDAFTGESLNAALGLYHCLNCRVYYHESSVGFLKKENNGRCVACSSTDIAPSTGATARQSGRNYEAGIVTLSDYKDHVGHVVTFQGTVQRVVMSRDRRHYALMFEHKAWRYGFKMVVFRSSVRGMGGENFLHSLVGKTIKIRGLLQRHDVFGYQIIATTRSMILDTGVRTGRGN